MTQPETVLQRFIGMIRAPRQTLSAAIVHQRSLDLALLILLVSAACTAGFLVTRVGELAALDQQVRQFEAFGATIDDDEYARIRRFVTYRPVLDTAMILIGWPLVWAVIAAAARTAGQWLTGRRATYGQVLAIVVHASTVLAVRSAVAAPVNYMRESLGGATSLALLMPPFGESTFPARLVGAIDLFILWWIALVAVGLGLLFHVRAFPVARWLFGAYLAGAGLLALAQAVLGGIE